MAAILFFWPVIFGCLLARLFSDFVLFISFRCFFPFEFLASLARFSQYSCISVRLIFNASRVRGA